MTCLARFHECSNPALGFQIVRPARRRPAPDWRDHPHRPLARSAVQLEFLDAMETMRQPLSFLNWSALATPTLGSLAAANGLHSPWS